MTVYQFANFAGIFLVFISCKEENSLPYYNTPDFTPLWKEEVSFSQDTLHTIAPFAFSNQDGGVVTLETFQNKIYVANFFFTICPGICPKLTANMSGVADVFTDNSNIMFISHSVTPDIDSVAQLKKYALEHGIRTAQWKLVTGKKDDIYTLARHSYFAEREIGFQYDSQEFLHTEHFILVDKEGHILGIYNGTLELEAQRLIEDIRLLLEENF